MLHRALTSPSPLGSCRKNHDVGGLPTLNLWSCYHLSRPQQKPLFFVAVRCGGLNPPGANMMAFSRPCTGMQFSHFDFCPLSEEGFDQPPPSIDDCLASQPSYEKEKGFPPTWQRFAAVYIVPL